MISQDKGETTLDGNPNMILSELALLTHIAQKRLLEGSGMPVEEFESTLAASVNLYRLTEAGMDAEEALEVTGIKSKIAKVTKVDIDGTRTEIDLGV